MTKQEFAAEMAWLMCAIRCELVSGDDDDAKVERRAATSAYYECLGDLPLEVFKIATRRVAVAHPWKNFPSIAELREAAALTIGGETQALTGVEAFGMAYRIAASFDPSLTGPYFRKGKLFNSQAEAYMDGLPPLVEQSIRRFGGLTVLANADPNFARREFAAIFDGLASREQFHRLLPAPVKDAIAAIGHREEVKAITHTPAAVKLAESFGKEAST